MSKTELILKQKHLIRGLWFEQISLEERCESWENSDFEYEQYADLIEFHESILSRLQTDNEVK